MIQAIMTWYWRRRYERACRRAKIDSAMFLRWAVLDGRRDAAAYKRGLLFARDPLMLHNWKRIEAAFADKEMRRQFMLAGAFEVAP